ncbi:MAG: serine/threonine protein kinase [Gemmatimonadetes bacterium]|nr:serine/threonine protein kinase [Gemmatimonadota bacterium]
MLEQARRALADRYRIDREIARGAAARVFRAVTPDDRVVALKILHPELSVSVTADRFLREIKLLAEIHHPRIARMLDYGEAEYLVYYVMDFVEGPTLREHLSQRRRATLDDTLHIARDLLGALGYAHERGIIHRDVKPENIVLSQDGAMLVDFGIARAIAASGTERLTRSGFTVGTSHYMSPEQVSGSQDIDHRGDLYSLGCVLFECLAGRPPFIHPLEELVMQMQRETPPPDILEFRLDTPPDLARAVNRAIAKERQDRWQSAGEMTAALGGSLAPA